MLVLNLKPGKSVMVGNRLRITVLKTGRGRVRLGFDGPRYDTPVYRQEVFDRIQREVELRSLRIVRPGENATAERKDVLKIK